MEEKEKEKDESRLWICEHCGYELIVVNPDLIYIACPECRGKEFHEY